MAGNFFRGTTVDQDPRWGRTDKKMLASMEKSGVFAPILNTKVDFKKVNMDIINRWITEKLIEVLGFEDDIVINMVINLLKSKETDPKKIQLGVTGFLEKKSGQFMEELWTLLVDAQSQPSGIPSIFIEKKKEEILKRQENVAAPAPSRVPDTGGRPGDSQRGRRSDDDEGGRRRGRESRSRSRDRGGDRSSGRHEQSDRNSYKHRDRNSCRERDREHRRGGRSRDRDRDRDSYKDRDRDRNRDGDSFKDRDRGRDRDRDRDTRRARSPSSSSSPSRSRSGGRRGARERSDNRRRRSRSGEDREGRKSGRAERKRRSRSSSSNSERDNRDSRGERGRERGSSESRSGRSTSGPVENAKEKEKELREQALASLSAKRLAKTSE